MNINLETLAGRTAMTVLKDRYLQPNEAPEGLAERVAKHVAQGEANSTDQQVYQELFYDLIVSMAFLPSSPTLKNAGRPKTCLSACFVISPQDSMESILQVQTEWGLIESWGGGLGGHFGNIRPKGDEVAGTPGEAMGPLAVMGMYGQNSLGITQGRFRRGAHMATMSISHPDILDFIKAKDGVPQGHPLSCFNISVLVTDEFLRTLDSNEVWSLINPRDGQQVAIVESRELWQAICDSAWRTGDPGIIFIDEVNRRYPTPVSFGIVCKGGFL